MSPSENDRARRVVFVSRQLTGESLRGARAIAKLDNVSLLGICEQLPDAEGAEVFADLVRIPDAHDARQLLDVARRLGDQHGSLDQMVTVHETLLGPVAEVGELLGLRGLAVSTVRRALDKSCLKPILERAGIKTDRHQLLTSSDDTRSFAHELGFPIVLKPLNGSGGLATWCIRSAEQLKLALDLMQPSLASPVLGEAYLRGQELCIDTITIANEPRFYSICCYRPSILEALEDSRIQWSCVMPRDISGEPFRDFIEQGLAAVRALYVGNAMTHMEGFLLEGGGVRFTDATLRPAGARIAPMLAFAYDIDPYLAWARVAVDGRFDGPWERRYSVGTVFPRSLGRGFIEQVQGVESVKQSLGNLLVDARLPRVGAPKSASYTGDGYITVRHPETQVVEDALKLIAQTVNITYSNPELTVPQSDGISEGVKQQWEERLHYFDKQLNRPAWDNDCLPTLNDP